ncbi:type II toxin-antitoxin system RelE/ParE family toxin [Caenispirillum salinarum]|uniref:type II toxin-antitoxin system RelE/ParE family toxin n=1 Tax=Caenispirillum salinarum TaxID=859058 RepID=UPI00384AF6C4
MRITWTIQAQSHLRSIREYIGLDNPKAAQKVARRIRDAAKLLKDHPRLGRPVIGDVRELVVRTAPYIIEYKYRAGSDVVFIVSVIHTARDRPPRP